MVSVTFEGVTIPCEAGERVRDVLLRAGMTPHNGKARVLNCRGFGTCGTCAVALEGPVSPIGGREQARLRFPPHRADAGLRLACQAKVEGDVRVTKYRGFWGEDLSAEREPPG